MTFLASAVIGIGLYIGVLAIAERFSAGHAFAAVLLAAAVLALVG